MNYGLPAYEYIESVDTEEIGDKKIKEVLGIIDRIKELSPRGLTDEAAAKIAHVCELSRQTDIMSTLPMHFDDILGGMAYDLVTKGKRND